MRQQQYGLGDVPNLSLGEQRLVVLDQRNDVASGDVAVIHDREPGAIELAPQEAVVEARVMRNEDAPGEARPAPKKPSKVSITVGIISARGRDIGAALLEVIRAEGTSEWRTCAHDESALVMDGEVTVELRRGDGDFLDQAA